MSNPDRGAPEGAQPTPRHGRCSSSRRVRHTAAALTLLLGGVILGALGASAVDAMAVGGDGHGFGHRHHGSPERMIERLRHKAAWMLSAVDATEDQHQRVDAILTDTVERLLPLREDKRATRQELVAELVRSDIDRERLEALRQRTLALLDRSSDVMLDAVVRAAEVLTPEQREELAAHHRRFRH